MQGVVPRAAAAWDLQLRPRRDDRLRACWPRRRFGRPRAQGARAGDRRVKALVPDRFGFFRMGEMTKPMAGRTVLVTGATSGIGKATAIGLAALGACVGITGRDLPRVEAAAVEIRAAAQNPDVRAFAADLSSQAEVRRLAAEVLDAYPRLDVLVNN